jgi:hypothetical protein
MTRKNQKTLIQIKNQMQALKVHQALKIHKTHQTHQAHRAHQAQTHHTYPNNQNLTFPKNLLNQKKNIVKIENATDTLNKIEGFEFEWIDTGEKSSGVLSQRLEPVLPHLVSTSELGLKSVNYSGLIAYLIESNKELHKRIKVLENLI